VVTEPPMDLILKYNPPRRKSWFE